MCSHGLRQLVEDKSVSSCQQTGCKLIVKTCYPQGCRKLFQQAVTSLQMISCKKPDLNRLLQPDDLFQLVHKFHEVGKINNLQQIVWRCSKDSPRVFIESMFLLFSFIADLGIYCVLAQTSTNFKARWSQV